MAKAESVRFYFDHAGYSYTSEATRDTERMEGARRLAEAAEDAHAAGCSFDWDIDPYTDSSEWSDDPEPWEQWCCVMRDSDGTVLASLYGIDFGRDGSPWSDPYRRVVEAELALEALSRAE